MTETGPISGGGASPKPAWGVPALGAIDPQRLEFEGMDVKSWVLSDFSRDEQTSWVPDLLDAMTDEINRLCQHDDSGFMSRVAHVAPAP